MSNILSIIVVNHTHVKYILNFIKLLHNENNNLKNYEIILVDNSLQQALRNINELYPEIKIIIEAENQGFGSANNIGVKNSLGDVLAFVNPDIELKAGFSNAIEYLNKHPKIGVLGIRLVNPDNSWQRSYGNFPTLWRKLCEAFFLSKLFKGVKFLKGIHEYNEYKEPTEVDWVTGAFMIVRREAFEEVNGFDVDYFLYLEDMDLCKRIKERGWKIVYYPNAEAIHYLGGETKLSKDFVIDHGDSPYIYFKKHSGRWSLPFLWLIHLIECFLKTLIFGSISIFSRKYKKSFLMFYNTLKFTLFRAPAVIMKLWRDKVENNAHSN